MLSSCCDFIHKIYISSSTSVLCDWIYPIPLFLINTFIHTTNRCVTHTFYLYLGGGNSNVFIFTPKLGEENHQPILTLRYFSHGLVETTIPGRSPAQRTPPFENLSSWVAVWPLVGDGWVLRIPSCGPFPPGVSPQNPSASEWSFEGSLGGSLVEGPWEKVLYIYMYIDIDK